MKQKEKKNHTRSFTILILISSMLLVGLSGYSSYFLSASAKKLAPPIEQMDKAIDDADWGNVQRLYDELQNGWKQYEKIWPALIDHKEITDIESTFAQLEHMVEQKDKNEAERMLALLKYYIEHVPKAEKVNLQNIL